MQETHRRMAFAFSSIMSNIEGRLVRCLQMFQKSEYMKWTSKCIFYWWREETASFFVKGWSQNSNWASVVFILQTTASLSVVKTAELTVAMGTLPTAAPTMPILGISSREYGSILAILMLLPLPVMFSKSMKLKVWAGDFKSDYWPKIFPGDT